MQMADVEGGKAFVLMTSLIAGKVKSSWGNILTILPQVTSSKVNNGLIYFWKDTLILWNVFTELCRINEHQKVALDLDPYVKKLLNARRRVVLVNNILQNAQVCVRVRMGVLW